MEDHLEARGRFWVSGAGKRRGKASRAQDDATTPLGTAQRTWHSALHYASRHLGDSARASEIVEEVAYSAAEAREQGEIKNPDSYLFSGVVRRVRRLLEKDSRVEYIGSSTELARLERTRDGESPSRLEKHILANEVMDLVNEHDRNILLRWSRGDEWDEIAEDLGTTVNGAQCRLCRALEKARERVLGSKNTKSKPLP